MHGDTLEQLYTRYYRQALLYALSLCGGNAAVAEDLVQEAFCRALLSLPDQVDSFPGWLMRVLRNLSIDQTRRGRWMSEAEAPEQASGTTPESLLLQREETRALYRSIGRLRQEDRELLTLFYFARLPLREIAGVLGVGEGGIRMRLHRARIRLRTIMEEDGYEL